MHISVASAPRMNVGPSTDRIWEVENKRKQKTVIVVKSKDRGARTKVTSCGYSPDGALIGGGTSM